MKSHSRIHFTHLAVLLAAIAGFTPHTALGQEQPASSATAQPAANESRTALTGTLLGRVVFDGPPPAQMNAVPSSVNAPGEQPQRAIDESLIVGPDGGIASVILWVRSADIPIAPTKNPLQPTILTFQARRIEPHVLVFRRDRPLRIVNDSGSGVNVLLDNPFQANVLLPSGQAHELRAPGAATMPVLATSTIHPWFSAWILPLDHDYFAVTGPEGRFEINNLPLGRWEFSIWHEKVGPLPTTRFPISRFPAGRFTWQVTPGNNDLGNMKVPPAVFDKNAGKR